jgi:predicted permease
MRLAEELLSDLRLAYRFLRRRPLFTVVAALTLGLGIGANTAVFSVVDAVLLRALPYASPERLVVLWGELPAQGRTDAHLSGPELAAIWDDARSLESMGAVWARPGVLRGSDGPVEEVEVGWITPGFLETLGVATHLGRLPTREEHLAEPSQVIVLSYELWQRRYGADPGLVGRTIDFDDERRTVTGVMPRGFRLHLPPDQGVPEQLAAFLPWGGDYRGLPRAFRVFTPVARLAPSSSLAQAASELGSLAARVRESSVDYARSGFGMRPEPLAQGVVAHVRPTLLVLLGVVTLVLVVAAANVAHLALARAVEAEAELGLRAALGAGRGRLFRQLMAESLLLGALGAGAGLALAGAGLALLRAIDPGRLPRAGDAALDLPVLAYAAGAALAASLTFGCVSALPSLALAVPSALRDAARARTARPVRLRRALVVAELALSLVLVAGAGLLVRSFARLNAVDPGFDPHGRLTARLSLPDVHYRYRDQGPRIAAFYRQLDERLRALPGVLAAGATTAPPLSGAPLRSRPYAWRGEGDERAWGATAADYSTVTPGWFEAAGVTLLAGRFLDERDDRDHPLAVVVDEALARRAFGSVPAAVGQPIRVEVFRDAEFQPLWGEVKGVVRSLRLARLDATSQAQVFLAHAQAPQRTMYPTLRVAGDPLALVPALQEQVAALEKELPVFDVRLASEHVAAAMAVARFALVTLAAFAFVAALLAACGVYSVMAHAVARRRYEIGVRLALGASPPGILRLVLRQGLGLAAAGIALGLVAALAATRVLANLLFGVGARDPGALLGAAMTIALVALAGCWLPARRAARVEPVDALRSP